jgi:hypothetical protein
MTLVSLINLQTISHIGLAIVTASSMSVLLIIDRGGFFARTDSIAPVQRLRYFLRALQYLDFRSTGNEVGSAPAYPQLRACRGGRAALRYAWCRARHHA